MPILRRLAATMAAALVVALPASAQEGPAMTAQRANALPLTPFYNVSGEPVLATGVVLVPSGEPPAGGWPVIAWAHGTAGVARVCAPSLMKDTYIGQRCGSIKPWP